MTEQEFTAYFESHYKTLLRYTCCKTRDFFAAEEATSQIFFELWKANPEKASFALMKQRVVQRLGDYFRTKTKVMGYIVVDDIATPSRPLEDFSDDETKLGITRPLEDIVIDLIELKEHLATNEDLWHALFTCDGVEESAKRKGIKPPPRHGTYSRYQNHKCRCEPCVIAYRQYWRDYKAKRKAAA